MVHLADVLGSHLVAEGIETVDQLHRLQRQQCNTGQGFLVARPMSAEAITSFVRSARSEGAVNPMAIH
jgi:EAL domain-containing protein (putative c-di-GMP-specific phosphodiesterase class I)